MASTNGILNPPSYSEPATSPSGQPAKRKRDDLTNGVADVKSEAADYSLAESKSSIRDLIDVLRDHDVAPAILQRPIPERPSSSGPQAKRQKADDNDTTRTILTRFSGDEYKHIDEVLADIDIAATELMNTLRPSNANARLSSHQSEMSLKIKAFKDQAHELVKREKGLQASKSHLPNGAAANGGSALNAYTQVNAGGDDKKMVLTLYGSAPGPKHLFSSLQVSSKELGVQKDIIQILREVGLPNGINITQAMPVEAERPLNDKKRVPTLGDLFPTPSTVPELLPPKLSKVATTRSGTVGWYHPTAAESLPRGASYSRQPISSGHWIDYSNASTSLQGTKRKRDRASSLVGGKAPVEIEATESEASKLEALFRSAYSGFAPTRDDSAAIAPAAVLNRMWWQQLGEKSFEKMVDNAMTDYGTDTMESDVKDVKGASYELEDFEKMMEELERDGIDPTLVPLQAAPEKSVEEKDVEEILQGISELLETLNSYQRIRHMSLNASSRPAGLLSAPDTTSLGTPSKPSEPEQATYEILKSQLTLMIASLPPYAVAKLDPDRLAELSISTKIEVQLNDYKGVMEEDEVAAAARSRASALGNVNIPPPNPRIAPPATVHRTSSASLYGNQYAPSRSGPTPPNQYYGASQTPIRPPSSNLQRPPATAPPASYPQRVPVPAAAPYRPTPAYGPQTYQHQGPRPVQQPYGGSSQQYLQNSNPAYMQTPSQSYQTSQGTPTNQMPVRYTPQPAYPHQTAAPQNGIQNGSQQYRYGNGASAAFPRQPSPQKPIYSPQAPSTQPRPAYSTPTPPMPQVRPYTQAPIGQPSMMNGVGLQTTSSQFSTSATTLTQPYSTFMTQEQQASLMERQKQILTASQGPTQQNARNGAMGNGSGGPVNGTSPVVAGL